MSDNPARPPVIIKQENGGHIAVPTGSAQGGVATATGAAASTASITQGGVARKKFAPKAPPAVKVKKEESKSQGKGRGGDGGRGKQGRGEGGRGRGREGRGRGKGEGRGGRGRGNMLVGQVFFSANAGGVPAPRPTMSAPKPLEVIDGVMKDGAGGPEAAAVGGVASGSGGGEGGAGDGGWMANRDGKYSLAKKETDPLLMPDFKREKSDDMMDVDEDEGEWPPQVTDKLEPISVNFAPLNEERRRAHEASVSRVFSDGTDPEALVAEEQDLIFIQLPKRLPAFEAPELPPSPPEATPVTDGGQGLIAVKPEPGTNGGVAAAGGGNGSIRGAGGGGVAGGGGSGEAAQKPAAVEEKMVVDPLDDVPLRQVKRNPLLSMGPGLLGKMRVHRSGRVTFVAGDSVTYEVQPGLPVYFAQDVATISPDKKTLCYLGSVAKKVVCLPDFSSLVTE